MATFNQTGGGQQIPKPPTGYIVLGAIVLVLLFFGSRMFKNIEPGHAGLVYETLQNGIDANKAPLTQGLNFIAPWNKVVDYEIRQRERTKNMMVLSSNLLDIKLDMTIFYEPKLEQLAKLHLKRGKNYETEVIEKAMFAVTREVIAKYLPEEINTTKRVVIQQEVADEMEKKLDSNYVQLNDILIQNIELPSNLRASIEKKLQMEQESQEYEFRIQKAEKEAQRKKIEAQGIQEFQNIVNKSITPQLLKWKGVEATEELAKSPNAKVVIVGGGGGGLPVILNAGGN